MSVVKFRCEDGTAYVTINRPEAKNALSPDVFDRLSEIWDEYLANDDLRVAIVSGAEGNFSAGFDLQKTIYESSRTAEYRKRLYESCGGLARGRDIYKPIIAAIEGWCVAGGFEFALACDLRVADETAKMGLYHVREGMPNGDGGSVRLPLIAGLGNAMELSLTGKHVTADTAKEMGIVNRVAEEGKALDYAEKYAEMIKRLPPQGVQSQKETILETLGGCNLKEMLQREYDLSYGQQGIFDVAVTAELIEKFFSGELDDKADRRESLQEAFEDV